MSSSKLLVHYDPSKVLTVACDASPKGLGAVLSQCDSSGAERPVTYASRSLAPAEKNYSQLDKEALAIIYAVKKFHQYLYGRKFILYTDHKPLIYLLDGAKCVSAMASARLQRWSLTLSAYQYTIVHRKGELNGNADALSRLPLPGYPRDIPVPREIIQLMEQLESTPVTAKQIKDWTSQDPVLSRVRRYILNGWPLTIEGSNQLEFQPYRYQSNELSIDDDRIFWGSRVIVPRPGRNLLLEDLHGTHVGISRMKTLARRYFWWPNLDSHLEELVKSCDTCQQSRHNPPKAPLHPWEWPEKPWTRIHIDYAGPYLGSMFLIITDAHLKWMDVYITNSSTAQITIAKLRQSFAIFGLPKKIVSDNAAVFTGSEFEDFWLSNGIQHSRSSPYHPSSNGLAERTVQTVKEGMARLNGPLETRLQRFLFKYRITPHTVAGKSPAEMMFGRSLRCRFDLLFPDSSNKVVDNQMKQKKYHDRHTSNRCFKPGDSVYFRDFTHRKPVWNLGIIVKEKGPLSYKVKRNDGSIVRRHIDHVKIRLVPIKETLGSDDFEGPPIPSVNSLSPRRSSRPPDRFIPSL